MEFQQTNILSMTGNDNFATTSQLANYVDLTSAQTISGLKTFNALPISSIVPTTTTQLVNKSYVDGLIGNYVDLTSAQTITGAKTFNANVRLNNTRNLYLGTTTGGILNYTLPNMYYDINSGGSHYFFVSGSPNLRIETAGLFIENTKYINWFSGSWLYENGASSRFEINAPTGFYHSLRINNVEKLKLDDDGNGSTLTFPSGPLIREYTPFSWFFHNVPLGWIYKWDVDGTTALQLSSSGLLVAGGGTISIQSGSGGSLILDDSFVGGRISGTGGNVRFDADVGADFKFVCDSTLALTIQGTGAVVPSNLNIQYGITGSSIGYSAGTTSLQYKIPTGTYYHKWYEGSTELMSLADGTYGLRTNDIDIFLTRNRHLYMDTSNNGIWIDLSGNFNAMSDPTKSIVLYAGAQQMVSVDSTGLIMGVSSLPSTFPKIYADYSKANWIDGNTSSLRFNCSSIGSHVFLLNNTLLGTYATAGFAMNVNNMAISIGATNVCSIRQNTTLTSMGYNVPTGYTHKHNINSVLHSEITTSGLKITTGYYIKQGSGTTIFGASVFNNYWTGVAYQAWIDGTNIGNYTICDYRIKENIQPARPVLERLCKIEMVEYEIKDVGIFKKHGTHHGMMAHQVKELFPELDNIVSGEKDAVNESGEIQPQTICAEFGNLAITAIQELNAKIEAQQAQIEAQQKQIDGLLVAMAKLLSP